MAGLPLGRLLIASMIAGFMGLGIFGATQTSLPVANITLESLSQAVLVGEKFQVNINVEATEPVNVFKGLLSFDETYLTIDSIDYNTSLADLWAEEPWYSNGEGTVNFTGGTTQAGGFTGSENLMTIHFTANATGEARLFMEEIQILRHDGFGSEAPIEMPLESIFTIASSSTQTVVQDSFIPGPVIQVFPENINTDLNGDGEQTFTDTSIFFADFAMQNLRSDFNQDGSVNLKDLSILTR